MPTKNIAASITAITPSFQGGLSLRICLSKSSWSRRFIFEVPILSTRNATKLPPFHTPSRKRIGFLDLKAIIPANGGVSHQFKEIKHQSAQCCAEQESVSRLAQPWPCLSSTTSCRWVRRTTTVGR